MAAGERVRAAAVELFAARGFHGTGIRDLAAAAGLSSAGLYHYMGTKEDLLLAIMRDSLTALLDSAEEARVQHHEPLEALAALVAVHVRTHAERPQETQVVDGELRALTAAGRAEVVALRDRYEEVWRETIAAASDVDGVTVADPGLTRLALIEMCSSVSRWYSPSGPLTVDEVADQFTSLAFGMLGATRRGARASR